MKSFLTLTALAIACLVSGCKSTTATSGPEQKKLTILKPADQSMSRGDTNKVMITVVRENFATDVPIRFDNLPEGVRLVETDKTMDYNDYVVTYTLYADVDASLVSGHIVTVTAEGPDGLAASEQFELTVKD